MYPGDKGALLTALLAHVSLEIGSAIYVPAGVPHSYIRGLGLEVMTTSDNVLRLGLTPKPIFADEAIEALDLDSAPQLLRRVIGEPIAPHGAPFEALLGRGLTGARAAAGVTADADADAANASQELAALEILRGGRFRLLLAIEGAATVTSDAGSVVLSPGSAAVISREESAARVSASGLVALVADC
jgi:mannose-6-phosphate isomerase